MTTKVRIHKGDRGVDFAYWSDEIRAWLLQQTDIKFVCLYLDDKPGGKGATQANVDWCHKNGFGVLFIKENRADDIDGGAPNGIRMAAKAKVQAKAFNPPYPVGMPITLCADKDVLPTSVPTTNMPTAVAFMDAGRLTLAPEYTEAGYADWDLVKEMEKRGTPFAVVCVPGARYWSKDFFIRLRAKLPFGGTAHMVQSFPPVGHPMKGKLDLLDVYTEFDAWLPKPDLPPVVPVPIARKLQFGSKGQDVKALQKLLGVPQTGFYGIQTRAAVKDFQRRHHLTVDGWVGVETRRALSAGLK